MTACRRSCLHVVVCRVVEWLQRPTWIASGVPDDEVDCVGRYRCVVCRGSSGVDCVSTDCGVECTKEIVLSSARYFVVV